MSIGDDIAKAAIKLRKTLPALPSDKAAEPTDRMLAALGVRECHDIGKFLKDGADPNAKAVTGDWRKASALGLAVKKNDVSATMALLAAGADHQCAGNTKVNSPANVCATALAFDANAYDVFTTLVRERPDIDPNLDGVFLELPNKESRATVKMLCAIESVVGDDLPIEKAALLVERTVLKSPTEPLVRDLFRRLATRFRPAFSPKMAMDAIERAVGADSPSWIAEILSMNFDIFNDDGTLRQELRTNEKGQVSVPATIPWWCLKKGSWDSFRAMMKIPVFAETTADPKNHSVAAALTVDSISGLSVLSSLGFDFKSKGSSSGKTLLESYLRKNGSGRKDFLVRLISLDPGILDVETQGGEQGRNLLRRLRGDHVELEVDASKRNLEKNVDKKRSKRPASASV